MIQIGIAKSAIKGIAKSSWGITKGVVKGTATATKLIIKHQNKKKLIKQIGKEVSKKLKSIRRDPIKELEELNKAYKKKIITKTEYQKAKKKLLKKI